METLRQRKVEHSILIRRCVSKFSEAKLLVATDLVDERCVGDPPFFADAQHSGMRIVRLDEDGPRSGLEFFAKTWGQKKQGLDHGEYRYQMVPISTKICYEREFGNS